ncbi:alpha/beta hydrolase [Brachybacterium sp. EF45031]|nr:alpha/beta hydrolase [Brachybacterium sillae]
MTGAGGVRLAVDATGHGDPVVLLHGSLLSRAVWRGSGYVQPLLQAGYQVVRMDLRGHGRSDAPHDPAAYTQDAFVEDLLAMLRALDLERVAVIGYSIGARVALTAALSAPQQVRGIVCLGGSAARQQGALDRIFFPGAVHTLREKGMEAFCRAQGLGPEVSGERAAATRAAFLASDPQAMAAMFTATDATAAVPEEDLASCQVPALWMAGDRDVPRVEESRQAAERMPLGRFVVLPGRDHGGTLVPPGPVLDEILPFLEGLPR